MQENQLPPPGAPDIEIARAARMAPILPLAQDKLGIGLDEQGEIVRLA
jgi:formate--tetrahydrofolate ligase